MSTVLAFERYPVQPGSEDDFRTLADTAVAEMRRQPGMLWADVAEAMDDRPSFVVLSEWRTEADLDAWEATGAAEAFRDGCDPLVREAGTRRRFAGRS